MTGLTYSSDHYDHFQNNGDKNFFEEVIDLLMLDNIEGMTDSFKETIKNLPSKEKRMTILSLLDQDYNLFKQIKGFSDEGVDKMNHIKDVILMLREYVKVGEVEKKKFGEVMTPLDLVKEMLSNLPEEVWSNPHLKWLDPANGTGPFPCLVIYRLMKGLENWEPDQEKRYRHIVENMIYVCELQPKNMFLYMCTIDPFDQYKLNVYTGSFLGEGFDNHMKSIWNLDKFDIILGNPPYQEVVGSKKTQQIWGKFIIRSFQITNGDGFLNFVHPGQWRFLTDGSMSDLKKVKDIYSSNQILFSELSSYKDGLEKFGANTDFDVVVVKKRTFDGSIPIRTKTDGIVMVNLKTIGDIIPTDKISFYLKLTEGSEKVDLLYSTSLYETRKNYVSDVQQGEFQLPVVYGYPLAGLKLMYSSIDRGHFGVKKLIMVKASTFSLLDLEGVYGLTQFAGAIVDSEENLIRIKEAVDSPQFKVLKAHFLGVVSQNTNACIDAPGNMFKIIKQFKKDFWKEFI